MSKCFIVLGMHRSATSLVAGGLQKHGVDIGEKLIPADHSNPWGHFEDIEISHINRAILNQAGGSWDNPPREAEILAQRDKFEQKIIEQINRRKGLKLWGWKDPRTTLTIKLWIPYLDNPHFVCCFRDPLEVAKSLQKRNGFSIAKGLGLAGEYNKRLTQFLQGYYV